MNYVQNFEGYLGFLGAECEAVLNLVTGVNQIPVLAHWIRQFLNACAYEAKLNRHVDERLEAPIADIWLLCGSTLGGCGLCLRLQEEINQNCFDSTTRQDDDGLPAPSYEGALDFSVVTFQYVPEFGFLHKRELTVFCDWCAFDLFDSRF